MMLFFNVIFKPSLSPHPSPAVVVQEHKSPGFARIESIQEIKPFYSIVPAKDNDLKTLQYLDHASLKSLYSVPPAGFHAA